MKHINKTFFAIAVALVLVTAPTLAHADVFEFSQGWQDPMGQTDSKGRFVPASIYVFEEAEEEISQESTPVLAEDVVTPFEAVQDLTPLEDPFNWVPWAMGTGATAAAASTLALVAFFILNNARIVKDDKTIARVRLRKKAGLAYSCTLPKRVEGRITTPGRYDLVPRASLVTKGGVAIVTDSTQAIKMYDGPMLEKMRLNIVELVQKKAEVTT